MIIGVYIGIIGLLSVDAFVVNQDYNNYSVNNIQATTDVPVLAQAVSETPTVDIVTTQYTTESPACMTNVISVVAQDFSTEVPSSNVVYATQVQLVVAQGFSTDIPTSTKNAWSSKALYTTASPEASIVAQGIPATTSYVMYTTTSAIATPSTFPEASVVAQGIPATTTPLVIPTFYTTPSISTIPITSVFPEASVVAQGVPVTTSYSMYTTATSAIAIPSVFPEASVVAQGIQATTICTDSPTPIVSVLAQGVPATTSYSMYTTTPTITPITTPTASVFPEASVVAQGIPATTICTDSPTPIVSVLAQGVPVTTSYSMYITPITTPITAPTASVFPEASVLAQGITVVVTTTTTCTDVPTATVIQIDSVFNTTSSSNSGDQLGFPSAPEPIQNVSVNALSDSVISVARAQCQDFCVLAGFGNVIGNGTQSKQKSCSITPYGELPDFENMVSTIIVSPKNGESIVLGTNFTVTVKITGLELGFFDNPDNSYYLSPQTLNTDGIIQGHTHITIQKIDGDNVPDARFPVFFKGLNEGSVIGELSVQVPGSSFFATGLGEYRISTMSASRGHAPILSPVARRGAQDDAKYINIVA